MWAYVDIRARVDDGEGHRQECPAVPFLTAFLPRFFPTHAQPSARRSRKRCKPHSSTQDKADIPAPMPNPQSRAESLTMRSRNCSRIMAAPPCEARKVRLCEDVQYRSVQVRGTSLFRVLRSSIREPFRLDAAHQMCRILAEGFTN